MEKQTIMYIIAGLILIAIIVILILSKNIKKSNLKKQINDIYVSFNTIKTTPLAFKLNKAQTMAKRNNEAQSSVDEYYQKYEEVEKQISQIQELVNVIDDSFADKQYKEVKEYIDKANQDINVVLESVKEIDDFLNEFSKQENKQRDYANTLKEKYRLLRNASSSNSNALSIAYEGIERLLNDCENRFSSYEDYSFSNEYEAAQDELKAIEEILNSLQENIGDIPELIKDTKGVIPLMFDELKHEYSLSKQRGVYLDHLNVDESFTQIEETINEDIKKLIGANSQGVKEDVAKIKDMINEMMDSFEKENRSFKEAKETNDKALENINDLEKLENYVRVAYDKDSARFGLEDLVETLDNQRSNIGIYTKTHQTINNDLVNSVKPASEILDEAIVLLKDIDEDKKHMYSYKSIIDKSNDVEVRANSELVKLQVVIAQVQIKIAQAHLPLISNTYQIDLERSKQYVTKLRSLLNEIPINTDELNVVLEEAIDFIFKFYNNVINIVGMAVMVENAIVFGNKYRSTYSQIDRDLSKAEFQYLNGEYTKAMKTAMSSLEDLFPENADEKILENVE